MKKILLLAFILITFVSQAQIPQGISYQALALNGSGTPVANGNVGIRLSILNTSATGTVLYTETQTRPTNAQGLFNLVIGQGTPTIGTFAGINWTTGAKFLKVEMDAAGGTNFVLLGTTQLLSTPYAMAAGSLVLAPGQGITLTSPNGTPYQVSVNNAGELSLPTSSSGTSDFPDQLYMYGTFNTFNPVTSLLMGNNGGYFFGFKYLTSGSQIKFLAANNASSVVYGVNGSFTVLPNAIAYTVPSNGFYKVGVTHYDGDDNMYMQIFESIVPMAAIFNGNGASVGSPTYNNATNTFSYIITNVTDDDKLGFVFDAFQNTNSYGDNLLDGTIDPNGTEISFPGANSTPKNYKVDLVINFNGSGNYTITQL